MYFTTRNLVQVDEKGAEAAAATAVVMTRYCAVMNPIEPKTFTANHGFTLALVKAHEHVLFIGRYRAQ